MIDFHRLVDRIVEVLGPEATPERVETIAAVLLDEFNAQEAVLTAAPRPAAAPGSRVVVTAFGADRPGILAAVTNVVSEAGCNIQDVSQKILQDYFTLIMLADTREMEGSIPDLQQALADLSNRLGVRIIAQHEDLFDAMHRP